MEKIKVSYIPLWDDDGYVYRCNITLSKAFFDKWNRRRKNAKDVNGWLSRPLKQAGNHYYLNTTQGTNIKNCLLAAGVSENNEKRLIFEANTSITIQ